MTDLNTAHVQAIAVTWSTHRRFRELCGYLNVPLFEIRHSARGIAGYWQLLFETTKLLRSKSPSVLLVQNPSLILGVFAVLYAPLTRTKIIVDAHNEAIQPYVHDIWVVRAVAKFVLRRADLTIVSNRWLADVVDQIGGRAFVLCDRIPRPVLGPAIEIGRNEAVSIAIINSGAPDEPLAEILGAASQFEEGVQFLVTGPKPPGDIQRSSTDISNVTFTGYLPDREYWDLLRQSRIVIDLTEMQDCLVCGAYEALAVGTPLILSDNRASRELFRGGVVFTKNRAKHIRKALTYALKHCNSLRRDAQKHARVLEGKWVNEAQRLGQELLT